MYVKNDIDKNDLDDLLWSGARDRWIDATDEQKEEVWSRLEDWFYDEVPTMTEVNDTIWFECDDIFFPEEEDEEAEESCKRHTEKKRVMPKRRFLRK